MISGVTAELAVMEGSISQVRFMIGKRKGDVRGAKLWKRIPLDMRMRKKDTAGAFKNALKNIF